MATTGTVTSKGQTTIPKAVRDQLGLDEGSLIEWKVDNGRAVVVPRNERIADMAGILGRPPKGAGLKVEDMDDVVAAAVASHVLDEDAGR
jgi:AbrB family looped-hinge helix DNA binding protein